MATDNTQAILACLPVLWASLRHIPLDGAAAKRMWRYERESTLYDLVIFSLLNASATMRSSLVSAQRRDPSLWYTWVPLVVWYNTSQSHEDFDYMRRFCNDQALRGAAYWFANNRPEVLRRYLATGDFRICAPCIKEWRLESVLADVGQTGSAPCVLETGMRGFIYAT